jgi:competence protein ComEA
VRRLAEGASKVHEGIEARLRQLAQRAGLGGVPPAVVAAAGVLFVLAVAWGAWRWWPTQAVGAGARADSGSGGVLEVAAKPKADAAESSAASQAVRGAAGATGTVFVHVVGAVHHPGLYELAAGSRVADAVSAAGGLAAAGAQEGVNLACVIKDGEQVVIPTREELKRGGSRAQVGAASSAAGAPLGAGGAAVNINTADAAALDTLPGVGPSTAAKIVADREANGPFATPDDLGRVPGIGPKKLEQLKPAICVN